MSTAVPARQHRIGHGRSGTGPAGEHCPPPRLPSAIVRRGHMRLRQRRRRGRTPSPPRGPGPASANSPRRPTIKSLPQQQSYGQNLCPPRCWNSRRRACHRPDDADAIVLQDTNRVHVRRRHNPQPPSPRPTPTVPPPHHHTPRRRGTPAAPRRRRGCHVCHRLRGRRGWRRQEH